MELKDCVRYLINYRPSQKFGGGYNIYSKTREHDIWLLGMQLTDLTEEVFVGDKKVMEIVNGKVKERTLIHGKWENLVKKEVERLETSKKEKHPIII